MMHAWPFKTRLLKPLAPAISAAVVAATLVGTTPGADAAEHTMAIAHLSPEAMDNAINVALKAP